MKLTTSPFFSVVIPTFNREKLVKSAIESVLNQEFSDFELLIIDDGSKDNTAQLVQSLEDKRIKYFYKENEERSCARNFGINKSKGNYICFLDSDDGYYLNHLKVLFDEINKLEFPKALFYTGIEYKNDYRSYIHPYNTGSEHPVKFIWSNFILMNSICVHRQIFNEYLFPTQYNLWEDTHLWLRIALNFPVFEIRQITCYTIEHEQASTRYNRQSKLFDTYVKYKDAINNVFDICPNLHEIISLKRKNEYVSNKAQYFIYEAVNWKNHKDAFKLLFFKYFLDWNLFSFLVNLKLVLKKAIFS